MVLLIAMLLVSGEVLDTFMSGIVGLLDSVVLRCHAKLGSDMVNGVLLEGQLVVDSMV